jgi:hypothetical protein
MARIEEELNKLAPFDLLLQWEASCAEAAATAAGNLSALAFRWAGETATWGGKLGQILDELVRVSAGRAAPVDKSSGEYLSALFEPLSLIHEDRTRRVSNVTAGTVWAELPPGPLEKEMVLAGLNHILLAGPGEAPDLPGAVLPLRGTQISGAPFVASPEDTAFAQFLHRVFGGKYESEKETVLKSSVPVIVELTPACDHAQAKRERLRFAAGLLWPQEHGKWIKKAAYLHPIGPLVFEQKNVILVLDSLHFFSLPKDTALPEPLFRLRSHVRADLQAWLGGHLARPGHLSL